MIALLALANCVVINLRANGILVGVRARLVVEALVVELFGCESTLHMEDEIVEILWKERTNWILRGMLLEIMNSTILS